MVSSYDGVFCPRHLDASGRFEYESSGRVLKFVAWQRQSECHMPRNNPKKLRNMQICEYFQQLSGIVPFASICIHLSIIFSYLFSFSLDNQIICHEDRDAGKWCLGSSCSKITNQASPLDLQAVFAVVNVSDFDGEFLGAGIPGAAMFFQR